MTGGADNRGRVPQLLAYIDGRAAGEGHARRARVRVAALFPPSAPFPTREDVDRALADTAPSPEQESPT